MKIRDFKIDYFILSPLILLFWGIFSVLFIGVVPVSNGFGWDGVKYGQIALDFGNLIGKIDSYSAGRIFPSVLIHYVLKFINTPINLHSVLLGFQVYNILILVLSAIFWVQIAKRLSLNHIAKWIGFCALFINYPLLNYYFFIPAQTEGTAFFMSILMIYSYLSKNSILLITTTIISFFTWPTMVFIGLIIFIYSNLENKFWEAKSKKLKTFFFIILITSPLLLGLFGNTFISGYKFAGEIIPKFKDLSKIKQFSFKELINFVINLGYLFFILWVILRRFDFIGFIKASFKKSIFNKILLSLVILVQLIVIKTFIYSPTLPAEFTFKALIIQMTLYSLRFPFQNLICHISYYGPLIILLILFFRDFINYLKRTNLPVLIIFLFSILFSLNVESRVLTNFYPFIAVFLIKSVDFTKISNLKFFTFIFVSVSLLYSKIWLPIELPSSGGDLYKFPMQWLFMNLGPWMNFQMYLIHTIATAIFFILFYIIIKKKPIPRKVFC